MSGHQAISVPLRIRLGIRCRHTRRACVILTLADHFLTKRIQFAPLSTPPGGNQRRKDAALDMWASKMARESTPLWVWLAVALLAIGAGIYVATVFVIEYVLTFF
jgi:hypothetical protein